jgi:hypothetical protein
MRRRLIDLPSYGRPGRDGVASGPPALYFPRESGGSRKQTEGRIVLGNRGIADRAARWGCEQVVRYGPAGRRGRGRSRVSGTCQLRCRTWAEAVCAGASA